MYNREKACWLYCRRGPNLWPIVIIASLFIRSLHFLFDSTTTTITTSALRTKLLSTKLIFQLHIRRTFQQLLTEYIFSTDISCIYIYVNGAIFTGAAYSYFHTKYHLLIKKEFPSKVHVLW